MQPSASTLHRSHMATWQLPSTAAKGAEDDNQKMRQVVGGFSSAVGGGRGPSEHVLKVRQMLESLQKLATQESQENRARNARETDLFWLPIKLEVYKGMQQAGVDYQAAVKEAGRGHTYGAKHCHMLLASLEVLAEGKPDESTLLKLRRCCAAARQDTILEIMPTSQRGESSNRGEGQ